MPPKKRSTKALPKAKSPPRKPVVKPGPKPKAANNARPPSNSAERTTVPNIKQPPNPSTPEWEKDIRSNYQRSKRRFKLSMSTMHDALSEAELIDMASSLTGFSQNTWGVSSSAPYEGSRRSVKRARGILPPGSKRARRTESDFEQNENAYVMMMAHMNGQAARNRIVGVNCPSKSRLLSMSLEVRELIYGYLLISPKPIMVKDDWTTPEHNPYVSHALMFVCKQFAHECTAFLFQNNTIVSLLRTQTQSFLRYEEAVPIPNLALTLYKNIILDCALECWNTDWFDKATRGMQRLVEAKASIDCLTLRFFPKKVGFSSTAHGAEANPITFADFLWYEGAFMKAVRALAPKNLIVVVKKEGQVKLTIKVDMKSIRRAMHGGELFATEESSIIANDRVNATEAELRNLEGLYKEIFEDHEKSVRAGKCQLLDESAFRIGSGASITENRNRRQTQPLRSTSLRETTLEQSLTDIQSEIIGRMSETGTISGQPHVHHLDDDSPWIFGLPGTVEERMNLVNRDTERNLGCQDLHM